MLELNSRGETLPVSLTPPTKDSYFVTVHGQSNSEKV
jgi:hypothetical protein